MKNYYYLIFLSIIVIILTIYVKKSNFQNPSNTPYMTSSPTPSNTPYMTSSPTPSNTPYITSSPTPSNTPYMTSSPTPSNTPYMTSSPTPSNTPYMTSSPTPSNTPYMTPSSTPTNTPYITSSPTPSNTPYMTSSPTPSNTPYITSSPTPTNTPYITSSPTPTNTPYMTSSPTPTNTPYITSSPTPINTPYITSSPTPINTPYMTSSPTPTNTPYITPNPINCTLSKWSDWTCDRTKGIKTRIRTKEIEEANGGTCIGPLVETDICERDCTLSKWSDWNCDRTKGIKTRTRTKEIEEANGGTCIGPLVETDICERDCTLNDWSGWNCDRTKGIKTRTRTKEIEEANGGTCIGSLSETDICERDCTLSKWSDWNCDRTKGIKTRTRTIQIQEANGGTCVGPLAETDICEKDCVYGDWSEWSPCDKTNGTKTRYREMQDPPANGGTCGDYIQIEQGQCDVDCEMSNWTDWFCDLDTELKTKKRDILVQPKNNGKKCESTIDNSGGNCIVYCDYNIKEWNPECINGYHTPKDISILQEGSKSSRCDIKSVKSSTQCVPTSIGNRFYFTKSTDSVFQYFVKRDIESSPLRSIDQKFIRSFASSDDNKYQVVSMKTVGYNVASLYINDVTDYIYYSSDYGKTFTKGMRGGWESVYMSGNGKYLLAHRFSYEWDPIGSDPNKTGIYKSSDYGKTWTLVALSSGSNYYLDSRRYSSLTSVSRSGRYQVCLVTGSSGYRELFVSNDYGNTFVKKDLVYNQRNNLEDRNQSIAIDDKTQKIYPTKIAMSRSGRFIYGIMFLQTPGGYLDSVCVSNDYGNSFSYIIYSYDSNSVLFTNAEKIVALEGSFILKPYFYLSDNLYIIKINGSSGSTYASMEKYISENKMYWRDVDIDKYTGENLTAIGYSTFTGGTTQFNVDASYTDGYKQGDGTIYICNNPLSNYKITMTKTEYVGKYNYINISGNSNDTLYITLISGGRDEINQIYDYRYSNQFECSDYWGATKRAQICTPKNKPMPILTTDSVDCKVSDWSEWTCDKSKGLKTKSRTIITQPSGDDAIQCPPLFETGDPCMRDCQTSDWSEWNCDRKTGVKTRTKTVIVQPTSDGIQCPPLSETGECTRDCQVSNWDDWSCDRTTGIKTRTRTITAGPSGDDALQCPPLSETGECTRDCQVSEWSSWTCNDTNMVRTKTVLVQPTSDGIQCPPLSDTGDPCKNCKTTDWSAWSQCDSNMERTRTKTVTQQPTSNGIQCPPLFEKEKCSSILTADQILTISDVFLRQAAINSFSQRKSLPPIDPIERFAYFSIPVLQNGQIYSMRNIPVYLYPQEISHDLSLNLGGHVSEVIKITNPLIYFFVNYSNNNIIKRINKIWRIIPINSSTDQYVFDNLYIDQNYPAEIRKIAYIYISQDDYGNPVSGFIFGNNLNYRNINTNIINYQQYAFKQQDKLYINMQGQQIPILSDNFMM